MAKSRAKTKKTAAPGDRTEGKGKPPEPLTNREREANELRDKGYVVRRFRTHVHHQRK